MNRVLLDVSLWFAVAPAYSACLEPQVMTDRRGYLPFRVGRKKGDWNEVAAWCVAQCGSDDAWQDEVPDAQYGRFDCAARWGLLEGDYWFASDRDAFAFKMRWC